MPIQEIPAVEFQLDNVKDAFEDVMKQLFDEDPKIFKGHSTRESWNNQVDAGAAELREVLNTLVEQFEVRLHNGEFA